MKFGSTAGTIRESVPYARKSASGAKRMVRRSLAEGLGVPNDATVFMTFRDARTGLAYIRSASELWERGLWLALDAYQGHVFWEFEEVRDGTAGQWRRLADRLAGAGVLSLEDALLEQQLEPVHAPLRAVFEGGHVAAILDGAARTEDLDALETRLGAVLTAVAAATGVDGEPVDIAAEIRGAVEAAFAAATVDSDASPTALWREERAALLGYLALSRLGALAPGADVAATSVAWFDELRLAPIMSQGLRSSGLDENAAGSVTETTRVLLALPRPSGLPGRGRQRDLHLLERWLALDRVRDALGVHIADGEEWLDRERLASLLAWALRLDAIETGTPPETATTEHLLAMAEAASYRVDRLRATLSETAPGPTKRPPTPKSRAD